MKNDTQLTSLPQVKRKHDYTPEIYILVPPHDLVKSWWWRTAIFEDIGYNFLLWKGL